MAVFGPFLMPVDAGQWLWAENGVCVMMPLDAGVFGQNRQ